MSELRLGPPKAAGGFTLTELVMALAVVAIVSAVAVSRSTTQINWNSGIAIALPPTGLLSL